MKYIGAMSFRDIQLFCLYNYVRLILVEKIEVG